MHECVRALKRPSWCLHWRPNAPPPHPHPHSRPPPWQANHTGAHGGLYWRRLGVGNERWAIPDGINSTSPSPPGPARARARATATPARMTREPDLWAPSESTLTAGPHQISTQPAEMCVCACMCASARAWCKRRREGAVFAFCYAEQAQGIRSVGGFWFRLRPCTREWALRPCTRENPARGSGR